MIDLADLRRAAKFRQPRSPAAATPVRPEAEPYPRPILFAALIGPPPMTDGFSQSGMRRQCARGSFRKIYFHPSPERLGGTLFPLLLNDLDADIHHVPPVPLPSRSPAHMRAPPHTRSRRPNGGTAEQPKKWPFCAIADVPRLGTTGTLLTHSRSINRPSTLPAVNGSGRARGRERRARVGARSAGNRKADASARLRRACPLGVIWR